MLVATLVFYMRSALKTSFCGAGESCAADLPLGRAACWLSPARRPAPALAGAAAKTIRMK